MMASPSDLHPSPRTILALESSCDDTAVAVVRGGREVLSSLLSSQIEVHQPLGGVLPELAAREHVGAINPLIEAVLAEAKLNLTEVDAVAATLGPGLVGSLLVASSTAKALALVAQKPFLGVHHLQAHVASTYLESDLEPPFLCLLVSGGHTQLRLVESYYQQTLLGETLDDAVGEAYDKVARLLGLPYPGGPHLDRLAATGNPAAYPLPIAKTQNPYDFSFSGLKTASLRLWERETAQLEPGSEAWLEVQRNLAASFQAAAVKALLQKTKAATQAHGLNQVAVAGGVAANSALREALATVCEAQGWRLVKPALRFCTDNAAMVGAAAYFHPYTHDWAQDVFSRGGF